MKGFITGTFDLFHAGHSRLLQQARRHCDELYVGILTDQRVKEKKGEMRPIFGLQHRLEILYNNRNVTEVRPIRYAGENSVVGIRELLTLWKPDIWICGAQQSSRHNYELLSKEFTMEYLVMNCEVIHTTHIINKIIERAKEHGI